MGRERVKSKTKPAESPNSPHGGRGGGCEWNRNGMPAAAQARGLTERDEGSDQNPTPPPAPHSREQRFPPTPERTKTGRGRRGKWQCRRGRSIYCGRRAARRLLLARTRCSVRPGAGALGQLVWLVSCSPRRGGVHRDDAIPAVRDDGRRVRSAKRVEAAASSPLGCFAAAELRRACACARSF